MPKGEKQPTSEMGREKVVQMPERETMIERLKEERLYGITEKSDRFLDRFTAFVAGSEKVGGGLALAWELALYDEFKDYPPQIIRAVRLYFEPVIDSVTPDAEVASQAKEFMKEALETARKGGK